MSPFVVVLCGLLLANGLPAAAPGYPALTLPDASAWGRNVQRTMRLLATSTPEQRHRVRILFYGQSITESGWSRRVAAELGRRFPHARLEIENRALGGFSSQLLVRTAETDLYDFQPDLLIFHVYGAHDAYESIIRAVRERTTAEILIQNDHVTAEADLAEETDPARLEPRREHWSAFMNHEWLPLMASRYGAELCDQRALWKAYLREHGIPARALLRDEVHLNDHGEWLMAEIVNAWLRYDPRLGASPAENWVTEHRVGTDVHWQGPVLRLDFSGSRVDLVFGPGEPAGVDVRLNGGAPGEIRELYGFTRALPVLSGNHRAKWPVIAPIRSQTPVWPEEWTLTATPRPSAPTLAFDFSLVGSRTGPDGGGSSDRRFVSRSGRVVIDPEDWNVAYALQLAGVGAPPDPLIVRWRVQPRFVDRVVSPRSVGLRGDEPVTVVHGLPNGRHTLELVATAEPPSLALIRVFRPPGATRPTP